MLYIKNKNLAIIALLVISSVVHFAWFGHPNTTVFDEVHFGKFISSYFTHEYYFDIHPPLGKLILAGWGKLWGFRPGFSFANIGDVFPDRTYLALRFLPSLAGTLLPLVIYGLAREFKLSRRAAFLAGIFVALDNALLVQSRLILLDSFLLLFGFGAVWCYLRWRNGGTQWLLPLAGTLGAMAVSIKWTGATFLALIVILELLHLWQDRQTTARRQLWVIFASFAVIPCVIYYATFMVHFGLLSRAGTGDAFMTAEFQHDLIGNANAADPELKSLSTLQKFVELNTQMYDSNKRLTATHPYASPWYSWPLMERPIFYWVKGISRIYLLGNPTVWWGSTVAIITLFASIILAGLRRTDRTAMILGGAWLMNMLPFMGITRVMFLYHYFTALIWAVLMVAYLVDRSPQRTRISMALIGLSLVTFIYFAPLTYGLPLSEHAYNARVWFNSWK
jgi:dolichyl-phosphate-mannose-protein mannosyltransferase